MFSGLNYRPENSLG